MTPLLSTPNAERMQTRFAPALKDRRSDIKVLTHEAAKKHDDAKRIGVIQDMTSFKGVRFKAATEPGSRFLSAISITSPELIDSEGTLYCKVANWPRLERAAKICGVNWQPRTRASMIMDVCVSVSPLQPEFLPSHVCGLPCSLCLVEIMGQGETCEPLRVLRCCRGRHHKKATHVCDRHLQEVHEYRREKWEGSSLSKLIESESSLLTLD